MDVRFANLNVRFTNLRVIQQDLLLHALIDDAGVAALYIKSITPVPESEPGPSLLPTPLRLFDAPTPLSLKAPPHVCRHCQSSTCDTFG